MRAGTGQRPLAVEVFAGIGGLSLGLERAGFDVAAAIELDPNHAAVHRFNFPSTHLLQADATSVSKADLQSAVKDGAIRHGRPIVGEVVVDLVAGGPPCQGFSVGGTHNPQDQRNQLVFAFAKIVGLLKPRFFLMENVPGLLTAKHKPMWDVLLRSFADAGYETAIPVVLNASDFGVPQQRRRMFLYGWQVGETAIKPPTRKSKEIVSVRDALALLPNATRFDHLYLSDILAFDAFDDATKRRLKGAGSAYALSMRSTSSGKGFERPWLQRAISGMALTEHDAKVVRRFQAASPGQREPVSRYPRLSWSGQSPTLRSGTGTDHGSHTPPRPIHPDGERVITVREAARLQSFPDWFAFHATKWHAWRGIGNSVPPLLAEAVLRRVANRFDVGKVPRSSLPFGDPRSIGYDAAW